MTGLQNLPKMFLFIKYSEIDWSHLDIPKNSLAELLCEEFTNGYPDYSAFNQYTEWIGVTPELEFESFYHLDPPSSDFFVVIGRRIQFRDKDNTREALSILAEGEKTLTVTSSSAKESMKSEDYLPELSFFGEPDNSSFWRNFGKFLVNAHQQKRVLANQIFKEMVRKLNSREVRFH